MARVQCPEDVISFHFLEAGKRRDARYGAVDPGLRVKAFQL
jgi:hypothetical protein